jgi:hypothetical protein
MIRDSFDSRDARMDLMRVDREWRFAPLTTMLADITLVYAMG